MKNTIEELSKAINSNAHNKGFWEPNYNIGEKLMLVVSELSEALEADRKDIRCHAKIHVVNAWVNDEDFIAAFKGQVKDTFEDELADSVIRLFDLAYEMKIDLVQHINAKMRFNATRPYKHGKKY